MSVRDLHTPDRPRPGGYEAVVAVAAAAVDDKIEVVIPGFDPDLRYGPCAWNPRPGGPLPQRGDPCLVVIDDQQTAWVVCFWPYA